MVKQLVIDAAPSIELLKCSRRIRVSAASSLDLLYTALQTARDNHDAATRSATELTKRLATRIREEASNSEERAAEE